jgi:hypothetical protein
MGAEVRSSKRGIMRLLSFIAEMGGADPDAPLDSRNRMRHLATGGLLVVFFVWGFFSVAALVRVDFHGTWPAALGLGLLFAAAVLFIDAAITGTQLRKDDARHRLRMFVLRGTLSIAVGLVISLSTLLFMFHDALMQRVETLNYAQAQADTALFNKTSPWPGIIAADKAELHTQLDDYKSAQNSLAGTVTELNALQAKWTDEEECEPDGRAPDGDGCGDGPISHGLKETLDQYEASLPALRQEYKSQISTASAQISTLNNAIAADQAKSNAAIAARVAYDMGNTGLVAQSGALPWMLRRDPMALLWPPFFIALDLTVVFLKVSFPESEFDRSRRRAQEQEDLLYSALAGSEEWDEVVAQGRRRLAEVAKKRIDADADRQIAAIESRPVRSLRVVEQAGDPGPRPWRLPRLPRRGRRLRLGLVAAVALALFLLVPYLHAGTGTPAPAAAVAQSINLPKGETLMVPVGSVTQNAKVTAAYSRSLPYPGNTPASREVTFSTAGKIVGRPVLALSVPPSETAAASEGALHVAYWSAASDSWKDYPATYNPKTETMTATLTHLSTWSFWTWNWASDATDIAQTAAQWEGRRARGPDCGDSDSGPTWVQASTGVTDSGSAPVLACTEKGAGNVLDVELVNNRPYGLMLHYNGATVRWGEHDGADSLAEGLADAIGDYAADRSDSLYLPPLSQASIGIADAGKAGKLSFTIVPTRATVLADTVALSLSPVIGKTTAAVAEKWGSGVFAEAAGSCIPFLAGFPITSPPKQSTVMELLASEAPECLKNILVAAGGGKAAIEAGLDSTAGALLSNVVSGLEKLISLGKWADIEERLGKILDFAADNIPGASDLGFSVLAA